MRTLGKLMDLLPVFVVVSCAFLGARIVNAFADVALLTAPPPSRRAAPRPRPPEPPHDRSIDALVARNMFCSDCALAAPAAVAAAPAADGRPPLSSLPLALVATVTTRDPSRSAATVVARNDGRAGQYGLGDVMPGGAVLRAVRASSVELMNPVAGRVERLELVAAAAPLPSPAPSPPGAPPVAAPAAPANELIAAVEKGVRKVQEGRYEVDRALIDRILGDPSQLMRSASVIPAVRDGKAAGFRLRGVRGGTIYAALGLQNGDTIRAVNGVEITGPDSALAAYAQLRDGGTFALSLERGGQPMRMEYAIR